jgi:hypothetical protein
VYWLMRQRDDPVDAALADERRPNSAMTARQESVGRAGKDEETDL